MKIYINTNAILYLASQSASRRDLLDQMKINYKVLEQNANEHACDWSLAVADVVENIAVYKMGHVILPAIDDKKIIYVLTADTLSQDSQGTVNGKSSSYEDAVKQLKKSRGLNSVYTAFCLDKKTVVKNNWVTEKRITKVIKADYIFDVPDEYIDIYLEQSIALKTAGSIAIENFGLQFLKEIQGSYTAIIGLPLFELREALEEIGFFD